MANKGDHVSWVQCDRYTWIPREDTQFTYHGTQNLGKKEQGREHKDIKKRSNARPTAHLALCLEWQ